MSFRSLVKAVVFWILVFVLSCATGPKVKQIAALHYGDNETDVVRTIGEGSQMLFFRHEGTAYHYRFYTTSLTEHKYALLFADGSLFAVSEERPPFDECIYQTQWDRCFAAAIAAMQTERMAIDADAFSDAVSEQERTQNARTGAAVVGAPVLVVTWPIFVGIGAMCATQEALMDNWNPIDDMERSGKESRCRESLLEIEKELEVLYPTAGLNEVIDTLNGAHLDDGESRYAKSDERIYDRFEGQRRIYGKTWSCGYDASLNLAVMYGADNGRLVWVSRNLYPFTRRSSMQAGLVPDSLLQRYWNDPQHKDARKWLCAAADTGHPEAQYRLGMLYENGTEGVPKDPVRAYMWYRISASTGSYMRAADHAQRIREGLTAEQAARAETLVREWKPGQCERDLVAQNPGSWRIGSINHLFGARQSLLTGVGTCGRSDSSIASEWRHGARIHPGDGCADALFPITPTP